MSKKRVKPKLKGRRVMRDPSIGFAFAIMTLSIMRYLSANASVIDKCDQTFKHWEYLQKQLVITWTSSFQFAPDSCLYFLFRKLVGSPAFSLSIWLEKEKLGVFYGVRLLLGILSVITESTLVVALSRKYGGLFGLYTLAMLCISTGCFFASTSFLPSSFSMYALSLSSAFYLFDRPTTALAFAAVGTIVGWPFLILAFLPLIVHLLIRNKEQTFLRGFVVSFVVMVISIRSNLYFHGLWTSSLENLLFYNVAGEDHSYRIEGLLYYLKNGFEQFNYGYVFAWLFPVIFPVARNKYGLDLLVVVSPMYILTAYTSLQPHKEERFLYSIYPLVCVAAVAVIYSLPELVRNKYNLNDNSLFVTRVTYLRPAIVLGILFNSMLRTSHLTNGKSTVEICKQLGH